MYWIYLIVIGGVIGWLASIVMRRDAQQGILLNIIVGIVGSWIGNVVLAQFFPQTGSIVSLQPWPLIAAFVGSLILLLILNLINRGRAR